MKEDDKVYFVVNLLFALASAALGVASVIRGVQITDKCQKEMVRLMFPFPQKIHCTVFSAFAWFW